MLKKNSFQSEACPLFRTVSKLPPIKIDYERRHIAALVRVCRCCGKKALKADGKVKITTADWRRRYLEHFGIDVETEAAEPNRLPIVICGACVHLISRADVQRGVSPAVPPPSPPIVLTQWDTTAACVKGSCQVCRAAYSRDSARAYENGLPASARYVRCDRCFTRFRGDEVEKHVKCPAWKKAVVDNINEMLSGVTALSPAIKSCVVSLTAAGSGSVSAGAVATSGESRGGAVATSDASCGYAGFFSREVHRM